VTSRTETPHVITMPVDEFEEIAAEGLRLGLERWKESCPCCFSEAYPGGLDQAVQQLQDGSDG
jgi:hypothetical protein